MYSPKCPPPPPPPVTSPPHAPAHNPEDDVAVAGKAPSAAVRVSYGTRVRLGGVAGGCAGDVAGAPGSCADCVHLADLSRHARRFGINVVHTTQCNRAIHCGGGGPSGATASVSLHSAAVDRSEAELFFAGPGAGAGSVPCDTTLVSLQWLE